MKKSITTALIAGAIIMASCSKDDKETDGGISDDAVEQLENTPLQADEVSDNMIILGATKNDGAPPTPNDGISLDLSGAENTAFLSEGFNIPLSSNGSLVGAYLQIKTNDGELADSYFDIDITANQAGKSSVSSILKSWKEKRGLTKKEDEVVLDVDFEAAIEPGTFCYVLCVYDGEGNISNPQEVCVTVESWGGNSAAAGKWNYVKEEITRQGETEVYRVDEPDCYEFSDFCANQEEYQASECYTLDYGILEINADGTFSLDFKGEDENLNYEASYEQCEAVYDAKTIYRVQTSGYWAYVDAENRLTLVGYDFSIEEQGSSESETLGNGEGELVYDGTAIFDGNMLSIVEEEDDDDDGISDSRYEYFFEKE